MMRGAEVEITDHHVQPVVDSALYDRIHHLALPVGKAGR
jgi:hypothetical protein